MGSMTPINARTKCIELAVEELSKRDSLTMTDVREFMDDLVSQKIPTGKRAEYRDPNGETHECELREPIHKFYKYKTDELEILTRAQDKHDTPDTFALDLKADVKLSDWLKDLKARSLFVAEEDIPKFIEWAYRMCRDIQETCRNGDVNNAHQNLQLQFDSVVKGCGKSTFIHQLIDGAKALGIPAEDEVMLPQGGFLNTLHPHSKLIVGFQEHTDQKIDTSTMMAIGRREKYTLQRKYQAPMQMQCRAITIGSSNGYPYCRDDRSMTVVRCNSLKFSDFPEELRKVAEAANPCNTTVYRLNSEISALSAFLQRKKVNGEASENSESNSSLQKKKVQKSEVQEELLQLLRDRQTSRLLLDVLQTVTAYIGIAVEDRLPSILSKVSTAKLSKLYKEAAGSELTFTQKNAIAELLSLLFSRGFIKKLNREVSDLYKAFDLTPLTSITIDDLSEEATTTAFDEIWSCVKEWDRIIKLAEEYENPTPDPTPDPQPTFLNVDRESKLDSSWTVCTRFDSEEKGFDSNGDQVCVNKPLEGRPKNRKNEGVKKANYLFECDDIPKEEQLRLIESLPKEVKDSVLWVCDSGGKSIHCVLHTNTPDDADSELRKYIHRELNKRYFNGSADPSGQNAARLARAPNAIRQDDKHPGVKQLCLHFNMKAVPLDVSDIIRSFNSVHVKKEMLKQLLADSNSYSSFACHTLQQLKEWNDSHPSEAKQECIDFLEGNLGDWNRGLACIRSLRNFGFTDYEIEAEGPANDKWIKQAIKAAK